MPEHRQWVDRYEETWKALDAKYAIERVTSLEAVLDAAKKRTGYPGGAARAVQEVKGDLVILHFYDRLLRELNVLDQSAKPDVPVIYYAVAEELYPVLPRLLPPGSETLNFVDYTSSRILKRQDTLASLGGKQLPAVLIYTLHDDNVGLLPMLVTGSLHELNVALRKHNWAGFSTRYWIVSDHDPCIAYLARASWDPQATPAMVYAELIEDVCGPQCTDDLSEAFEQVEKTTRLLELECLGLTFPVPGMINKHMRAGPMPEHYTTVREGYQRALAAVRRARQKTRPAGEAFVDYWIGRLEFGIGYFDCIEATRHAMTLKAQADQLKDSGNESAAKRKLVEAADAMQRAVDISQSMLESYARVAQDQSDAGAIATMAEYVYRPLKAKVEAWSEH
jgi:hypothetical protein